MLHLHVHKNLHIHIHSDLPWHLQIHTRKVHAYTCIHTSSTTSTTTTHTTGGWGLYRPIPIVIGTTISTTSTTATTTHTTGGVGVLYRHRPTTILVLLQQQPLPPPPTTTIHHHHHHPHHRGGEGTMEGRGGAWGSWVIYIHIHSLYDVWPMGAWPFLVFSPFGWFSRAGGHFNPAISCANALSTGKVGSLTASSEQGPKGWLL